jgi:hypothetical protein
LVVYEFRFFLLMTALAYRHRHRQRLISIMPVVVMITGILPLRRRF